ncbi:MAG: hypothetical protein A2381_13535 [Bdellovibrionales bacterium RIFOXYB1_FULL_37_110]|nr:MAG: hypothetical protein A2417_09890 [Bdellovibrionales bacterium RIFOXYC1_FULL_37_79]OFZ59428.1 MAG: hypothetical protein A2381_13535 [Bdellovibrionales bacterium RIFOXYB1_FULL_37_110]OFZ64054.1 MAG: hypothetical protein A2577_14905 [Bdellovibrionales bacterium RIFOXYD1_FULL_36_51]
MKNESKDISDKYYRKVAFPKILHKSWRKVFSNGIMSTSPITRRGVEDFSKIAPKKIEEIKKLLMRERFVFQKAKGIPIHREGKSHRPIVVSPIENRIVQRSILNVLHGDNSLVQYFDTPTSFGGIENKSVKDAVTMIHDKIIRGAFYYIRSDIKNFFTKIPREDVLKNIENNILINDQKFMTLLRKAVTIELDNLNELKGLEDLFPIHEEGVAQGSCLSPLFGNIFLKEFDDITNSHDVTCVRFVDDFVIVGPSEKAIKAKFKLGLEFLNKYGLEAYDPFTDTNKAGIGEIKKGFEFLGCKISPHRISPSKESVGRIKKKINNRIEKAKLEMQSPRFNSDNFVRALYDANNILKGWGNSYQFCNDKNLLTSIDDEIDLIIKSFFSYYEKTKKTMRKSSDFRRMLGVHLLTDSKAEPIIKGNEE